MFSRENQGTFVGIGEMHGGGDVLWAWSMLFVNQKHLWKNVLLELSAEES
ncbi:hypothetical protein I3760_05G214100 [Carya illinoinensis]|nr:hypothetical protein I3760_05G214100 [Carya illinoinensis]